MPNDKLAKQEAFTLIELIIVITIIGLLTSVLALDFRGAQDRQELGTLADQSLAMMQQTRAEVVAGKVQDVPAVEDDGVAILVPLCEGVYFEVGATPQLASGLYDAAAGGCTDLTATDYGLSTGDAEVSGIFVDGASYSEVWALYAPPAGDFYLDGEEGDLEVLFGHAVSEELAATLFVSNLTGQAVISSGAVEAASSAVAE